MCVCVCVCVCMCMCVYIFPLNCRNFMISRMVSRVEVSKILLYCAMK